MDRKPASHLGHVVRIVEKPLDQCDIRLASHSFISHLMACEALQICASRTFLLSEGHSAFPDQRMALFSSRFQCAENPLLCPSGAKGAHFAGILGDCWLLFADSKRPKTVWWTWSGSNRRPLPCHGSALPAAPQAHRETASSLHELGAPQRWSRNQPRSSGKGLF